MMNIFLSMLAFCVGMILAVLVYLLIIFIISLLQ